MSLQFMTTTHQSTPSSWYSSTSSGPHSSTTNPPSTTTVIRIRTTTTHMSTTTFMGNNGTTPTDAPSTPHPHDPIDLAISRIALVPCGVVLLLSTALLIYLLHRRLIAMIQLYSSLIVYIFSQILLFTAICVVTFSVNSQCWQWVTVVEVFSYMLPGFSILLMAYVNWVHTSKHNTPSLGLQGVGLGVAISLFLLISCLPYMGVCQYMWWGGYCGVQHTTHCTLYKGVVVGVGHVTPLILTTLCLLLPSCSRKRYHAVREKHDDTMGSCHGSLAILNTASSAVWISRIFVQDIMPGNFTDISYLITLICVSISPSIYILTSPSLRQQVYRYSNHGNDPARDVKI